MKVIQYLDYLNDGGVETVVKNYCQFLKDNGDTPVVVVNYPRLSSAVYKEIRDAGIEIITLFEGRGIIHRFILKLFWKIIYRHKLSNIIKEQKPDVVHIHKWNLHYIVLVADLLKSVRLYYTCHGLPEVFLCKKNKPREYRAALELIKKNNLQMIALHEPMKNEINNMFSVVNTVVMNNGIDFSKFHPITINDKERLRKEIGLNPDDFVLGHVGRFEEVKNQQFILKVFEELIKIKSNAKLLLIGNGSLKNDIMDKAGVMGLKDKIIILQHRSDVNILLRLMDVFIFPSLHEGLPLALLEAQISDLRCLVSDTVPSAAILSKNAIPLSLDLSPKKWCEAIFDMTLTNPHPGDINQYDMQSVIKDLVCLYRKGLSRNES